MPSILTSFTLQKLQLTIKNFNLKFIELKLILRVKIKSIQNKPEGSLNACKIQQSISLVVSNGGKLKPLEKPKVLQTFL